MLGYGAEGCRFEIMLGQLVITKVSLSNQQQMGASYKLGKAKAVKGEALLFIRSAQDTVSL